VTALENNITSIRNRARFDQSNPCNSDGIFNWDSFTIIDGRSCFPRTIKPMDIDLNVEIRYQHIIMESKDEGVPVPDGQMQALLSLLDTSRVTLICIWGKLSPTSWSVKTRSRKIMPIVLHFGGIQIKSIGPMALIEQRATDCGEVFEFLRRWSAAVESRG
jgi:hypothetical protein